MSTKADVYWGNNPWIRIYEETSEPKETWGKFRGFNLYMIIEPKLLESFRVEGQYITICLKDEIDEIPQKMKIWGDCIESVDWDIDGLEVIFIGGHHITKKITKMDFSSAIPQL